MSIALDLTEPLLSAEEQRRQEQQEEVEDIGDPDNDNHEEAEEETNRDDRDTDTANRDIPSGSQPLPSIAEDAEATRLHPLLRHFRTLVDVLMTKPLIPNHGPLLNFVILEGGVATWKFLKLAVVFWTQTVAIYWLIRYLEWEHDPHNDWRPLILYQSNLIWLDLGIFFIVGRHPETTTLGFLAVSTVAAMFMSWISTISCLQHSFTLYELHCTWTLGTWIYAVGVVGLSILLACLHLHHAWKASKLCAKLLEFLFTGFAVGVGPLLLFPDMAPDFHFHHWMAGWFLGMHANLSTNYSRLAQAWCFGLWVNGIAVWGRDPLFMCSYIDYYAHDQHCHPNWLQLQNDPDTPDWKHCKLHPNYFG